MIDIGFFSHQKKKYGKESLIEVNIKTVMLRKVQSHSRVGS